MWIGTFAVPTAAAALVGASIAAMVSRLALPESLRSVLWIQGSLTHVYLLLISAVLAVLLGDKHLKKFGLQSCPMEFLVKVSIAGFVLGGLSDALSGALRVRVPELFGSFSIPQQIIFVWLLASLAEEALTRGLLQGMMSVWAERFGAVSFQLTTSETSAVTTTGFILPAAVVKNLQPLVVVPRHHYPAFSNGAMSINLPLNRTLAR